MVNIFSPSYSPITYNKPSPLSDESASSRKLDEIQPSWTNLKRRLEITICFEEITQILRQQPGTK